MAEQWKMVIPCLLGIEGLVGDELRAMEAQNVEPQNGPCVFYRRCVDARARQPRLTVWGARSD